MHLRLLASDITSPHPSPCQGEGAACHCEGVKRPWQSQDSEMQKHGGQSDVQHDVFSFVKRTYRLKDKFSSRFTLHSSLKKRAAFTLAEVLITLGIIGVVAALTLPSVIQNYKNHSVEAKLKKFYSAFNQAVERSMAENGDVDVWYEDLPTFYHDSDSGQSKSEGLEWFNKYIGKYMQIVEVDKSFNNTPLFKLADGTSFMFLNDTTRDYAFFTKDQDECLKYGYSLDKREMLGVCAFPFIFDPTMSGAHKGKYLEPYAYNWNGSEEELYRKCEETGGFCTKLIQYNGWKIPKDYPRKVR